MLGAKVGNYKVTRKLAQGGMGEVYVARHEMMGRDAVVKVLLPAMSAKTDMVERFFNEARAASSIHHPGIVEVFDMGYMDDGRAYLVMEKLRGEALSRRLGRKRVSHGKAVAITRQLARALGAAHEKGIIHRDLKPHNLFLVSDPEVPGGERVKILDFGVAKLAIERDGAPITAAGAIFGTPAYMAPEQCMSTASVDHRADLYAVGCILYEMLCRKPPFGRGGIELMAAQLRDPPPPPRTVDDSLPGQLETVVLTLLAKEPHARFQSCDELIAALDECPVPEDSEDLTAADDAADAATRESIGLSPTAPVTPRGATNEADAATALAEDTEEEPSTAVLEGPGQTVTDVSLAADDEAPSTTHTAAAGEALEQRGGRAVGRVALAGVVTVLAVGAVWISLRGSRGADEGSQAAGPLEETAAPAPAPPDAQALDPRVARLVGEGMYAIAEENWAVAAARATQALGIDPGNPAALRLQERAASEIANRATFGEFEAAVRADAAAELARLFASLPESSAYRAKARPTYERARDVWMGPHLENARRLANDGRCAAIDPIQTEVAAVFADGAVPIQKIADDCRENARERAARSKAASAASPPARTPEVLPAADPRSADELAAAARQLATTMQFGATLRLCEQALAKQPDHQDAAMTCVLAACNLANAKKANRYFRVLKSESRQGIAREFCLQQRVKLR